jgi:hypothetical protein
MVDTQGLLQAIQKNEDLQEMYRGTLHDLMQERTNLVEALRKEVAEGHSTGDPIRDLMLRAGYGVQREHERAVRDIADMIAGKKGELVYLTVNCRVRTKHVFGHGWEFENVVRQCVGILSDDTLHIKNGVQLPIDSCVCVTWSGVTVRVPYPIEGDISENRTRLFKMHESLERFPDTLIVGDKRHDMSRHIDKIEEKLGRLVLRNPQ